MSVNTLRVNSVEVHWEAHIFSPCLSLQVYSIALTQVVKAIISTFVHTFLAFKYSDLIFTFEEIYS